MLTFSDDRIIRGLGGFIPVALDRQTRGRKSAHDRFFWKVVEQKPLLTSPDWSIETFRAAQGCYVFNSDGRLYGKVNDHEEVILDLMAKAREAFDRNRPGRQDPVKEPPDGAPSPPEGTLIARVYSRITPLPEGAHPLNRGLGRDFLWVPPGEVRALLEGEFPATLRRRLALGHLRDNVRGEPGLWDPEHVRKADFRAETQRKDGRIRVSLSGEFQISAPHGNRGENHWAGPSGYEGKFEGELAYDVRNRRVTRFVLYAKGQAWGEVDFTPGAPAGKFPLRIAFVLAEEKDTLARVLIPYAAGEREPYLREGTPSR